MNRFVTTSKLVTSSNNEVETSLRNTDEYISSDTDADLTPPRKITKRIYKQNFREEWTKQFKWVQNIKPLSKQGEAFCKLCNKSIHGGLSHLRRHSLIDSHKKKEQSQMVTPKLNDTLFVLQNKKEQECVLKMLAFVAEHNLPVSIMDHLPLLIKSVCPDSKIIKNVKCCRTKTTAIINEIFANENFNELCNVMRTHSFSLIIDETTDISTAKCLVVIVRYFDLYHVKDHFYSLIELESSTAETITDKILDSLHLNNIPVKNMVGLAADNATVMMGQISGVQARLKMVVPGLFVLGCTCHSFHLCASAACLKLPKTIEQFTRDIFNYFSNSSKRLIELHECQVFLEIKPNKLLRPSQTRWLSLQLVVQNILKNWQPLTLFFQRAALEDNLPTAHSILNALRSPIYKLYFLFLNYILNIINTLNIQFQSEKPKITSLLQSIVASYKSILMCFLKKTYIDNTSVENIDVFDKSNYLELNSLYLGAGVENFLLENENNPDSIITENDVKSLQHKCLEFYIELCVQIKKRFSFNDKILKSLDVFNPNIARSGNILSVMPTLNLFKAVKDIVDIESINTEWRFLPYIDDVEIKNENDLEKFWSKVCNMKNNADENMFPNIIKLISHILALPHSSASAERIFSQLSLIKTKTRNRLLVKTCESLLHTKYYVKNKTDACFNFVPNKNILDRMKVLKYEGNKNGVDNVVLNDFDVQLVDNN